MEEAHIQCKLNNKDKSNDRSPNIVDPFSSRDEDSDESKVEDFENCHSQHQGKEDINENNSKDDHLTDTIDQYIRQIGLMEEKMPSSLQTSLEFISSNDKALHHNHEGAQSDDGDDLILGSSDRSGDSDVNSEQKSSKGRMTLIPPLFYQFSKKKSSLREITFRFSTKSYVSTLLTINAAKLVL